MSKGHIQVHVAETMEDIGVRAIDAWHRMERGMKVNEKHVSFATWETMVNVLSPERLDLLRYVHQHPTKSILVLAQALHRDHRRVHEDVEALEAAGLLDRDGEGLHAEYDAFDVRMRVAL